MLPEPLAEVKRFELLRRFEPTYRISSALKNMKNTEMPHPFEHIHNEQSPNLQGLCSYGVYITYQS